jgi:hypothetical protein
VTNPPQQKQSVLKRALDTAAEKEAQEWFANLTRKQRRYQMRKAGVSKGFRGQGGR